MRNNFDLRSARSLWRAEFGVEDARHRERALQIIAGAILIILMPACSTATKNAPPDPTPVTLTSTPGVPGFTLAGPYGLAGTLAPNAQSGAWVLAGTFNFPTAGYDVAAADVMVEKSLPEQVTITVRVAPPPKDAVVAQVITPVPVNTAIPVSARATFKINVQELQR